LTYALLAVNPFYNRMPVTTKTLKLPRMLDFGKGDLQVLLFLGKGKISENLKALTAFVRIFF